MRRWRGGGGNGGGNGGQPPTPTNNPPVITTTCPVTVDENSPYVCDVDAVDADGDAITYSLPQAPDFLGIDSSTGVISGTPDSSYAGKYFPVTARASDSKGGTGDYDFTLNVVDVIVTHNVAGKINSLYPGESCIVGADVELKATDNTIYSDTTDGNCDFSFTDLPEDTYYATISDPSQIYQTHKLGDLIVNQQKADEGKLSNLEAGLYPAVHQQFVNETIRHHRMIKKYLQKPVWDIYTKEVKNGNDVSQTNIDGVKDVIKNDFNQKFSPYTFTDADINIQNDSPPLPTPLTEGHIIIYWDDTYAGGGNSSWFNGNEILSGFAYFNTLREKPTWLQEIGETLIGGGETINYNNYYYSIFYDDECGGCPYGPIATNLSLEDNMLSNIHKERAAGNTSPDNNPSGYIWNE